MKTLLKKFPRVYKILQRGYHFCREILERYLIGTKIEEWFWKNQKGDWAEGYLKSVNHPHRAMLMEAVSHFEPISSILEIGCASGPNLILLSEKHKDIKIVGIDLNKIGVKCGNDYFKKAGIKNVEIFEKGFSDLKSYTDKSFDIILTDAVMLYLAPDKIKQAAVDMLRIAKHGIIMVERHSDKLDGIGKYNMGNWLRNYEKLFKDLNDNLDIKKTKIPEEVWGGEWGEYGYVFEIIIK